MSSSRRPSSSSDDSGRSSPIQGFDSSAALILVPDNDDPATSTPFGISSDEDYDSDEDNDGVDRIQASAFPPLSSISVFLYLLSPFLKFGAILLPSVGLPLKVAIPALLFFAVLTGFTRQIWYMLARYVRRADLEEIVLETFARDRRKEGRRLALRQLIRLLSGVFRVLMAAMYVRGEHQFDTPRIDPRLQSIGSWGHFTGHHAVLYIHLEWNCHFIGSILRCYCRVNRRAAPRNVGKVLATVPQPIETSPTACCSSELRYEVVKVSFTQRWSHTFTDITFVVLHYNYSLITLPQHRLMSLCHYYRRSPDYLPTSWLPSYLV